MYNRAIKVDVGIFAHNEEKRIHQIIATLKKQVIERLDIRIVVLANGCTDGTVDVAKNCGTEVAELELGGKSRTWNRFVHELSRQDVDIIIFSDADIILPKVDALQSLVNTLVSRRELEVVTSRPVKDIEDPHSRKGWQDELIAKAGGTLSNWKKSICGQLYAMPSAAARKYWLPVGLPVEDGFLRALVLTGSFTSNEDFSRIDGEDVWHVYESERKIAKLIRHQTRIVIGSAINAAIFREIQEVPVLNRAQFLKEASADQCWLKSLVSRSLPAWPYGYVPIHFLMKRSVNILRERKSKRSLVRLFILLPVGFVFDFYVYVFAQYKMARGVGVGYW